MSSYQFSSLSNRPRHTQQAEYGNGGANSLGRYEYIWLPTDSGDAIPIGLYKSGKFFAVHSDHLGTPRLITDETNTPVWQWPYSAFGESSPTGVLAYTSNSNLIYTQDPTSLNRLKLTTPGVVYNLRHAGQYADSETGLFYNYFRTYDPKTGRYSQNDPIGLGGGLNRFGYVGGNALMYTDPTGLQKTYEEMIGPNPSDQPVPPGYPVFTPRPPMPLQPSGPMLYDPGYKPGSWPPAPPPPPKGDPWPGGDDWRGQCIRLYAQCQRDNWTGNCGACLNKCTAQQEWPFQGPGACRPRKKSNSCEAF